MRSKGDRFRRIQAISDNSDTNDRLAADVSSHFGELSTLIVDSTSREAFNLAYLSLLDLARPFFLGVDISVFLVIIVVIFGE